MLTTLVIAALIYIGSCKAALDPNLPPGKNFNLGYWKLQLPVNCDNGFTGTLCEQKPVPPSYSNSPYFYTSPVDGALVFFAPYNGITTSGSIHPRSELRELDSSNSAFDASWNVTKMYATFSASVAVNQLAKLTSNGSNSTVVIGQIKGSKDGQFLELFYSPGGVVYWQLSPPDKLKISEKTVRKYVYSAVGVKTAIPLNEIFDYSLRTNTTHTITTVTYKNVVYSSIYHISTYWKNEYAGMYYKAGCYCQVANNKDPKYDGTGACQVSFYSITSPVESAQLSPTTAGPTNTPISPPFSTYLPSQVPSVKPLIVSSQVPSVKPSIVSSKVPSVKPSIVSSKVPSVKSSVVPFAILKTVSTTTMPTYFRSLQPTKKPTSKPTLKLTTRPSSRPSRRV